MRLLTAFPLLFLAACNSQSPSAQTDPLEGVNVPPPPAQFCARAKKMLEDLGTKGAIDYDDQGQATVPQDIWMGMGEQHSRFAEMLAVHAACAHPDGKAERQVTIRNETGGILMDASIRTATDLGPLMEE
jgi:hypothetical protein